MARFEPNTSIKLLFLLCALQQLIYCAQNNPNQTQFGHEFPSLLRNKFICGYTVIPIEWKFAPNHNSGEYLRKLEEEAEHTNQQ